MSYKVLFVYRRQRDFGNFSIENYFASISSKLSDRFEVNVWVSPYISNGIFKRLLSIISLWWYCKNRHFDIIHITGDVHFLVFAAPRRKVVLTIHDVGFLYQRGYLKKLFINLFWLQLPCWYASKITCVSDSTRQAILKSYIGRSINPIIVEVCIDDKFILNSSKLPNSVFTILHIGTSYNKNLERLILACSDIKCHLNIVGHLNVQQEKMLSNYSFSNFVNLEIEDLIKLYNSSDMLFFCSTFEGFGMPILEAQAVGIPVLTSNIIPMADVAGVGAILVDPYCLLDIKNGILAFKDSEYLRHKFVDLGVCNVSKYNPFIIASKYEDIYLTMHLSKM